AAGCPSVPAGPPTHGFAANFATALAFAPDGRLFFTDRGGTVYVVEANVPHVFAHVSTVTTQPGGGYSERGLLGLAISPTFTTDHYVYALYDLTDYQHEDVVRWTDCGGVGVDMTTLITLPSGNDCCHKGGRLAFGPDGELYVTLGDEHTASAAQNTSDVRGKILRYNPDGSIPSDNPFGPADPVWAYGLRNPFGLAFGPSGTLMVTSNGPSGELPGLPSTGYDTVVTVTRGAGYEWPLCYGYSHPFAYERGTASCGGEIPPDWSSERSTVVPTGATFVDSAGPAGYAGKFVFCTLDRGMLIYSAGSPHGSVAQGPSGCNLDVKEGPDDALYFSSTTQIYRLA
ncbi:MAG: PQQ-dependent sugar dehydrogenase, partial [Candidatus Dormiibacterota bacterium]